MSPLLAGYKELLAQTQQYLTELSTEGQAWVYADPSSWPKTAPQPQPQPQARVAAPVPPQPPAPRTQPAPLSQPAPVRRPEPAVPAAPPGSTPVATAPPTPKPQPVTPPAAVEPQKTETDANVPHQPFSLTPAPAVVTPDLADVKALISSVAPAMRLIETIPAAGVKSVQRIPEGAIALILTPHQMNPQANMFLEAVADAIELRFGPCGILDSHALVSAKQKFPAPGPRLIPIADPSIYLREPMRKAELWNEIRRKLGKPTLPPR